MYSSLSPFSTMSYGDPLASGYSSLRPGGFSEQPVQVQSGETGTAPPQP